MKLSVILPSIRPGNLPKLYKSISESFSGEFEMVVVSPYPLPRSLEKKDNITLIKDFGNPTRCQQIALLAAKGEYIVWASDDGYFFPKALDISFSKLDDNYKTIVIGKYYEGSNNPEMENIKYYYVSTHNGSRCKYVPEDCLMLMVCLISRKLLLEIGGFDTIFEVLPMAFNDLSIRVYNYKCNILFQNEMMFTCGHMPGTTGDHGPIHIAQTYHDTTMFKFIYSRENSKNRTIIDIDNWKNSPEVWERRFKKS